MCCFFLRHRQKCPLQNTLSPKALGVERRCLYGNNLAGWNLEGHVSPLLLFIELCIGRTGQKHSGRMETLKYPVAHFAGKRGWAPPLDWSSRASCEWAAKSPLLAQDDARVRLAEQPCSFPLEWVNSLCSISRKATCQGFLGHGNYLKFSQSVSGWLRANDLTEVLLPPDWLCWGKDVADWVSSCFSADSSVSELRLLWYLSWVRTTAACLSLAAMLLLF